mgnify:CR=1 FL=1
MKFSTLTDALTARRTSTRALGFIEGDQQERTLGFAEMHARALGLLRHFQACGAGPGSEMVILVDNNAQFIDAFWACVLGNIIAVPLAPGITDEHKRKVFRVASRLADPRLCTDRKLFARLDAFAAAGDFATAVARLKPKTVFLDAIDDIAEPGQIHAARADDIAFVQYSSGSTSEPKGVALTHRNLLTNIDAIAHGIDLTAHDVGLSWMPLTHDMGLIGFHLTPFVMDVTHYLIPTAVFVRHPRLWLAQASTKKATILCSPNFECRNIEAQRARRRFEAMRHTRRRANGVHLLETRQNQRGGVVRQADCDDRAAAHFQ